jgi:hypothetical protein
MTSCQAADKFTQLLQQAHTSQQQQLQGPAAAAAVACEYAQGKVV